MILRQRFSTRVAECLEELGWSKADLARAMDVDPPYLSQYLNGRKSPGLAVIERFATALDVDAAELLRSSDPNDAAQARTQR